MRGTRKAAVVAAGLAMAAAGAAMPAAQASAAQRPGGLGRFYQQEIHWHACTLNEDDGVGKELDKAGARCADLTVPLDYADPGGRTTTIAVSRLAADPRVPRIGTMFLNGGGPGANLDLPPYIRDLMGEAGPRYDLVAIDPRSIGRSAPVDCGWPSGTWLKSAGIGRASFDRSVAFAKDLAERCGRLDRERLRRTSSRNIARDMDVVRGALGERKVSYNGASYGTYLGAVYNTMFPGRLDRVVLDSSADPTTWGPGFVTTTQEANDHALGDWAAWTAKRDAEYGLGDTRAKVLATVRSVHAASARAPLSVGRFKVDDGAVPVVLFDGLGTDEDPARAALAGEVKALKKAADEGHAEPTTELEEELTFELTGAESQTGSGQSAIICGDRAASRDVEDYWRAVQREQGRSPLFAGLANGINACAFWPVQPAEPATRVGGDLPALMVAATGDTRTTYAANQAMHRLLGGSRMITLPADVHAPYQRGYPNTCVHDRVNAYFLTGKLPARDLTCAVEAPARN